MTQPAPPAWQWLGRLSYSEALERQRARRDAVVAGVADEVIWLLEHPPVVTTGRRPADGLPTADALAARGIELHHTERGGLATWHGPGQLVAYVIVDAWSRGLGVRGLVSALEDGVIAWLRELDLHGHRRDGFPGVWVGRDKVCAIGLHFRRGVSMHGLALNLSPDLDGFSLIVPCGITDGGVTSVGALLGSAPDPSAAAGPLAEALVRAITCGS